MPSKMNLLIVVVGLMSKPCACCNGWNKKRHPCTHENCAKPCKRQEQDEITKSN